MASAAKAGMVLGVFALVVALFIPVMVSSTQENVTDHFNATEGDPASDVTDKLEVEVVNASGATHDATIRYRDSQTLSTNQTALNVSDEETVTLSGANVTTGLEGNTETTARFNVTYPPTFGWNEGAATFVANLDTILGLLGAMMILGSLGVVLL